MRIGLILSVLFHGGLLAWALISLVNAKEFKPAEVQNIPMDIVDVSELTKLKAGLKKEPEKKETKKPDPKKPVAKQIEPEKKKKKPAPKRKVEAAAAPEPPKPEIKKPEVKKPEVKPEPVPKKKVAEKPKPKPKPKKIPPAPKPKPKVVKKAPPKKKKNFDEDKIAALLNKVPDAGASTSQLPDLPGAEKVKGDPEGRALTMSINEIDLFRRQVSQCWNPPVGGLGAEDLLVKLRLELNSDGTLKNQPRVMNRSGSPFFRAAADSATRAIWQCQPYNLPQEKYKLWRDMIINFDPRNMLRG